MRDPYDVLGVAKGADESEIKRAYRRLAKKLHPDANRDDPKAQDKFAELTGAYDLLSDKQKRGQFDRGEIDAEGKPRMHDFASYPGAGRGRPGGYPGFDADTIFESFSYGPEGGRRQAPRGGAFEDIGDLFGFGRARRGGGAGAGGFQPQPGADTELTLAVSYEEAVAGAAKRVTLPNGKQVEVKVAANTLEGHRMRLKGQGEPSATGGRAGDAYVTISYAPHAGFRREGEDLRHEVPVPLEDAVLGAKVRVPTLTGAVDLNVPAWTSGGKVFRLRGKGLPKASGGHGDLLVEITLALPADKDPELEALMRKRRGV